MGVAARDAARAVAERRWFDDLRAKFGSLKITYAEILTKIDQAMNDAATDAELRSRGAGLSYLMRELKLGGS